MIKKITQAQRTILLVLALINFFNYVDRQVIFPLFGHIKAEFHVSDFALGLLGTAFMLVHSLFSLPLAVLADKYARKTVIAAGVLFWSAASFASGLAKSFKLLLGIRAAVGVGEAAYAPAAVAMISDNFPAEVRAQAQGWFNAGMFLGGTLGVVLGGLVAHYSNNWRLAFFLVSLPGIVLAVWSFRLRDQKSAEPHQTAWAWQVLLKNPAYLWFLIGGTFSTFASGAWIAWGIEFVVRFKGYNLFDASLILGVTLALAGLTGIYVGGVLADYWQNRVVWGRSLVVVISHLAAAPFIYAVIILRLPLLSFLACFFLGAAIWSFYHGPATAVIHDLMPANLRATSFAVYALVIHFLGDTLAPAAVGRMSDSSNLMTAMKISTFAMVLSGLAFYVTLEYIRRKKVPIYLEQGQEPAQPALDDLIV